MKKTKFIGMLTAFILLMTIIMPTKAAAAVEENWRFFSFANEAAYGYYTINTTNLQVSSFTVVNNWPGNTVRIFVTYDANNDGVSNWQDPGDEILLMFLTEYGQTRTEPISNFKFHRLPATDPDDPNSIRYPNKVTIGARNE